MAGVEAAPVSEFRRWLIFGAAIFPASLAVGTQTVANAVLPQMQGDLSAGLDQISWVITAAVVAAAIAIPPTAWLTARFGRRRLMVTGMLLFSGTSMMVGTAETLGGVVFWRMASAVSAAPMIALSQSVTLETFSDEQRGKAFAFWAIGILSGWVFAPALGAYVAEVHSWRLIFFLIGPLAVLGALTASIPPETERDTTLRFDWFGFGSLSLAIGSLLLVLNRGQRLDWFESPEVIFFTALGGIALYVFAVHTSYQERPLLRFRMFLDRNYSLGLVVVSAYAALSLAPLVLIPTMLEELRGLELLTTGVALIPRGLSQIVGLLLVGMIVTRADPRVFVVGGLLVFAYASAEMASFNLDVGLRDVLWPNLIHGFSMAFIWAPVANVIYGNLAPALRTDAVTFSSLLFSLSSSIGVSLSVTTLGRTFQQSHEELAAHLTPANEMFRLSDWSTGWNLVDPAALGAMKAEVAQQALMIGYTNVYWGTALYALAVIPFALLLRTR